MLWFGHVFFLYYKTIFFDWLKIVSKNHDLHRISFSDCAVIITQPFGVITSPGYPQLYRNGIDCTWSIQLSIGQLIQFNFLHFDVVSMYCEDVNKWALSASDIFFPTWTRVYFDHTYKILLISGAIHWQFMMVVQIHRPCWEIHIVVIPCHLAKHRQAISSSFIFSLIII